MIGCPLSFRCVGIRFKLMLAAGHIRQHRQQSAHGGEEDGEEKETSINRYVIDLEGGEQFLGYRAVRRGKEPKEIEDDCSLENAYDHALDDMLAFEVTDFMSQHTDESSGGVVFDQGVEEGDFFIFPEACEEGIGFGRAF